MIAAGLISLAGYLPGKKIQRNQELADYLLTETLLYPEYIQSIQKHGILPGTIETNYEGWESQPWFETWLNQLPPQKKENPFQGAKERRRVPLDPLSLRKSIHPHPMLSSDAETLAGAMALFQSEISKEEI